jgi:hypothetical protein
VDAHVDSVGVDSGRQARIDELALHLAREYQDGRLKASRRAAKSQRGVRESSGNESGTAAGLWCATGLIPSGDGAFPQTPYRQPALLLRR